MPFTYPPHMKQARLRLNSLLLALGILSIGLPASAQVPVTPAADARPSAEVVIEAKVIGIPVSELGKLGMIFAESSDESESPLGFAVVLPESETQALQKDAKAMPVHSLKLQGLPGSQLRFRVDSRAPLNTNSAGEVTDYFEVGMRFEVTPSVFPSRKIALSSSSLVQVRRGPGPQGGLAPVVFETQAIKHDIQIPEGKTILLGGFLTGANSAGLPAIPKVTGNPLLAYMAAKSPRKADEIEIVVLLTPRVIGSVEPAPPPPMTAIPTPVVPAPINEAAVVAPISASNLVLRKDIPAVVPPAPPAPTAPVPSNSVWVPTAPVKAPPALPKSPSRHYTVQVGAFSSMSNAEELITDLKKRFGTVLLDQAPSGSTPYRVRVGRLTTLKAAKRIQSQLKAMGFDALYIVPPDLP